MAHVDYISKFPVTAKLTKKPESDWEKKNAAYEVHLEGPRLSFANLWHLDTQQDGKLSTAFTSSVLIPLLEQNEPAMKLIDQVCEQCAKSLGTSYAKILGKQRRIKRIAADAVMMEDGVVVEDDDGNPKPMYNRGHMIINTSNPSHPTVKGVKGLTKWPIRYFSTSGKALPLVPSNNAEDPSHPFNDMIDPGTGKTAHEMVGTGNNVRIRLQFTAGVDAYNGNKPKVYCKMTMVQFFHEDETFGSAAESDTDDMFGAVEVPAGGDSFDDEIPEGNPAYAPKAEAGDDDLFSDEEMDMFN